MKICYLLLLSLLCFPLLGCDDKQTSDQKQQAQQEQILQEGTAQVGMPAITNFTEKKLMKEILERRDQVKLATYTYIVAEQTGKLVFLGHSYGFGLPYSTQYTNPQKFERPPYTSAGYGTLPQADPNGLFSPPSAEGTWIMMLNPKTTEPDVVYIEPRIIVSPFPLTSNGE